LEIHQLLTDAGLGVRGDLGAAAADISEQQERHENGSGCQPQDGVGVWMFCFHVLLSLFA
jgi:hypothetical protein